uniref:Uncharacterized protein n=1 Tax=Biomphalaria glabrata TaxID=6526 RepID=A0A2C9LYU4_BIOGL
MFPPPRRLASRSATTGELTSIADEERGANGQTTHPEHLETASNVNLPNVEDNKNQRANTSHPLTLPRHLLSHFHNSHWKFQRHRIDHSNNRHWDKVHRFPNEHVHNVHTFGFHRRHIPYTFHTCEANRYRFLNTEHRNSFHQYHSLSCSYDSFPSYRNPFSLKTTVESFTYQRHQREFSDNLLRSSSISPRNWKPETLKYWEYSKRKQTFNSWPREIHFIPKHFADAGFFYKDHGDCVSCFYCGGSLTNWEAEEDAWIEHARWFPNCNYLIQQMGRTFVATVQELDKVKDH